MKKFLVLLLFTISLIFCICSCTNNNSNLEESATFEVDETTEIETEQEKAKVVNVTTTIFPIYDFVREITKNSDNINLSMLINSGIDLHNFQPSVDDILKVGNSDLFIYIGGESDEWVDRVLDKKTNNDLVELNLMDAISDNLKIEELKEGMMDYKHEEDSLDETQDKTESKTNEEDEFTNDETTIEEKKETGDVEEIHSEETNIEPYDMEDEEVEDEPEMEETTDNKISSFTQSDTIETSDTKTSEIDITELETIQNEISETTLSAENIVSTTVDIISTDSEIYLQEEINEVECDEHIWLSLKNAKLICRAITDKLILIDPENSDLYQKNLSDYLLKLDALDKDYQSVASDSNVKILVFGDRFPFRYLTDDYNIDYYAAFKGCSAETEASFDTIMFLSNKLDEYGLNYCMAIDDTTHNIAETVVENSNDSSRKILSLNSMQSINETDIINGANYIEIMKKNLEVFKIALANEKQDGTNNS